jgi:hypothetical protein
MLRLPDGGAGLELASFIRPNHEPGSPAAMANELGLRSVAFEVDDVQAIIERLAKDGHGLVGGIGEYEHVGAWPPCAGQRGSSSLSPSESTEPFPEPAGKDGHYRTLSDSGGHGRCGSANARRPRQASTAHQA